MNDIKAMAERLNEQQTMLNNLKLIVKSGPERLADIQKRRDKLDEDEKVLRSLLNQAPARIEQLEKEVAALSPFNTSGEGIATKTLEKQTKIQLALNEILQTISVLPADSALRKSLIAEVEKVALNL